jgi:hypothetical protein
MLLVTRQQRQEIGEPAFVTRVVTHFHRYHIEAICEWPEELLRKRIEHCIARGRKRGLTWEYSLTVFAAHMIRIHPEFDEQFDIRQELENPVHGTPDERIDALPAYVPDRAWDDAEKRGDPEAYWRAMGLGRPMKVEVDR